MKKNPVEHEVNEVTMQDHSPYLSDKSLILVIMKLMLKFELRRNILLKEIILFPYFYVYVYVYQF
jgi:hypothetical protein